MALEAQVLIVTGLTQLSTPLKISGVVCLGFQSLNFLVHSLVHESLLAIVRTDAIILIEGVAEVLKTSVRPDD